MPDLKVWTCCKICEGCLDMTARCCSCCISDKTETWVVVKVVYCHIITDDLVKLVNLIKSALN